MSSLAIDLLSRLGVRMCLVCGLIDVKVYIVYTEKYIKKHFPVPVVQIFYNQKPIVKVSQDVCGLV